MTLGALLDLGIDQEQFLSELKKLNLENEYKITIRKGLKNGISGTDVDITFTSILDPDHDKMHALGIEHDHHHTHEHDGEHDHIHTHHHHHASKGIRRNLHDIRKIIEESQLSHEVKRMSIHMFERLAAAEAKIHNTSVDEVHFHEVGAVDAIVDIVGTAICMDLLKPERIISSPVNVGGGLVKIEHGVFPVPAPATLELLKGVPIYSRGNVGELVTPTGAVILSTYCTEYTDFPPMIVDKIGYGLGKKSYDMPNCLRVCLGESGKKLNPLRRSAFLKPILMI